ncbi:Nuclease subunit of the excinuclease complex [Mycobacteroides abscessus subsp. abscessus]|nr:Nuclease subunit of the excinuclease complex [Mycobacteroides abscessus subsp. abscessus]
MPAINDFEGLNKITRKQKGVYVLWGNNSECLYVGRGKVLNRLSFHLTPRTEFNELIVSITVYICNSDRETSLLEYALIHRYCPIYNRERRWNNIVGLKYKDWGEKFTLKKVQVKIK